jgi:paraquat-inducible protein B
VPKRPHPALVGVFVIGGALLLLLGLTFWGSGRLLGREYRYVCYFPGSVNGLALGAPVKYRGVQIGRVDDLLIPYSASRSDARIAVVVALQSRQIRKRGGDLDPSPEVVGFLVERGLRARLQSESIITGVLSVSLDIVPDAPPAEPALGRENLPEIPTLPSETEQLSRMLLAAGESIPRVSQSITRTLDTIDNVFANRSLGRAFDELPATARSVRRLTTDLDVHLFQLGGALRASAESANADLIAIGGAISEVRSTLAQNGPLVVELQRTLADVRRVMESIRTLTDYLERNPNALVVGKP